MSEPQIRSGPMPEAWLALAEPLVREEASRGPRCGRNRALTVTLLIGLGFFVLLISPVTFWGVQKRSLASHLTSSIKEAAAKNLTNSIKKAATLNELLGISPAQFNQIHFSACWTLIGRMVKRNQIERRWLQQNSHALEPLLQHTAQATLAGKIRGRALSTVAYAAACSSRQVDVNALFGTLARAAEQSMRTFDAQGLSNTAWAFAKVGYNDLELFRSLARAAEQSMRTFNAQELANTAWAFAKVGHNDLELFGAIARAAEQSMRSFNAQNLANTAWAFAKVGYDDPELFGAIARAADKSMHTFNAQDLDNMKWAFAKVGYDDPDLFRALSRTLHDAEVRHPPVRAENTTIRSCRDPAVIRDTDAAHESTSKFIFVELSKKAKPANRKKLCVPVSISAQDLLRKYGGETGWEIQADGVFIWPEICLCELVDSNKGASQDAPLCLVLVEEEW